MKGDLSLRLKTIANIFFSSGHVNYARYGGYLLRQIESLPADMRDQFEKGAHGSSESRTMEWHMVLQSGN